MEKKITTVLFDLDGTLADTSLDLTASLNQLFKQQDLKPVTVVEVKPVISKGSSAMLKLRLSFNDGSDEHETFKQQLFTVYSERNHDDTLLFHGMDNCLKTLQENNITWGIVTNKLSHLAKPVIEKLKLDSNTACLVCPDDVGHAKPHPAPLLEAAKIIKVKPEECMYVGDAKNDMIAAHRANMMAVVANYGFIPNDEDIYHWNADAIIEQPLDLLTLLNIN